MKVRVLTFDGENPQHHLFYAMLEYVRCTRGHADPPLKVTAEVRREEAAWKRAAFAIGTPTKGADPKIGEFDLRPRVLRPDGGTMRLELHIFKRLQEYLERTQWGTDVVDYSVDLDEWVDDAEKISE